MSESPDFRVSDQERDRAAQDIREHYAAGRLTEEEMSERVEGAYAARTQRELRGLLADLPQLPVTLAQQRAELAERRRHLQRRLLQQSGGGLAPVRRLRGIWASDGGHEHHEFWPIWVLLVVVLPLIRNGWRLYGPAPELDRVEAELARRGAGARSPPPPPPPPLGVGAPRGRAGAPYSPMLARAARRRRERGDFRPLTAEHGRSSR